VEDCDLDFVGIAVLPAEAHPVLIIETNAILPGSVAVEPRKPGAPASFLPTGHRRIFA
jgi:hypothetical protein